MCDHIYHMQAVRRLREYEASENRERQCVVAVSANIEDNIVGTSGFDLQRSKPLRQKDIISCMSLYASKSIPLSISGDNSGYV